MKNKVLLSRLCICTLAVSLLAGCSSAGSTSETTNNSETESISSETASETVSENESATTASFASLEKTDLFEQQNSIDEALQHRESVPRGKNSGVYAGGFMFCSRGLCFLSNTRQRFYIETT